MHRHDQSGQRLRVVGVTFADAEPSGAAANKTAATSAESIGSILGR
jgi:hypothetical protein